MQTQGKNTRRMGLTLTLCVVLLLALVLPQAALAGPHTEGSAGWVEVTGPSTVNVGEEFEVSVIAKVVTGLFGGQFELSFDPTYLQVVEESLVPGTDLEPSIVGVDTVDNVAGSVLFAVSRQGDVEELSGEVIVLATMHFTALTPVESTTIDIGNVLLGDKSANVVPVDIIQGWTLSIVGGEATVQGQVTLEGQPMGSWDGSVVSIEGTTMTATTDGDGYFEFIGVEPGTHTFEADADGYLRAVCEGAPVVAPLTTLMSVELVAGDVNGDDVINIIDAVAIGVAFGDPASNPAADLNDDGNVNVLDLILMAVNFDLTGPTTWMCIDP